MNLNLNPELEPMNQTISIHSSARSPPSTSSRSSVSRSSPDLEIAAVTDRVSKSPGGGPALLFERPTGFDIPVAVNLFGSMKRMCMALGVARLDDLAAEIDDLATPKVPAGMLDAVKMLPKLSRLRDLLPKTVSDGPCQEVVLQNGSLDDLPILKCWPNDGGRYITLPLVFTKDPETGMRNIGTYRMQVFDGRTTGMHWQRHKGGAQHHRVAERLGKRLPVAVALGPDPALAYSATAPMPEGLDELMLAGFLRRERVELVKCVTVDLEVPANAQIVLEGYVEPGERRREGPVRRSHRLLLARRRLPGLPHHVHHPAPAPDLSHHRRRDSADGGLLPRQGERADLPAADPEDAAGDRRHGVSRPPGSSTTSCWSRSTSATRAMRARS